LPAAEGECPLDPAGQGLARRRKSRLKTLAQQMRERSAPAKVELPPHADRKAPVMRQGSQESAAGPRRERRKLKLRTVMTAATLSMSNHNSHRSRKLGRAGRFLQRFLPSSQGQGFGEVIVNLLIVANAVSIGVSIDCEPDWPGWTIIDATFAIVFASELACRLRGGIREFFCSPDSAAWNAFESVLVVMALVESVAALAYFGMDDKTRTSHSRYLLGTLRVLRLGRVARILRVCRLHIFNELMMLINGAIGGLRTLLWSHLIILLPLYLVAMILRQSLGERAREGHGDGAEYFATMSGSLFTSFRCLVAGDCTNADGKPIFVHVTEAHGFGFALLYCFTTVFMTFGIFNVIVAIYVENTVAAAKFNDIRQKQHRLTDQKMFTMRVMSLMELAWRHHENNLAKTSIALLSPEEAALVQITPELFEKLHKMREFQDIMKELDVTEEAQLDLFETLDVDAGGTLDLEELVQGIAKLRGDARRSDVVSVSLMVRALLEGLADFQETVEEQFSYFDEALRYLHRAPAKEEPLSPMTSRPSLLQSLSMPEGQQEKASQPQPQPPLRPVGVPGDARQPAAAAAAAAPDAPPHCRDSPRSVA